MKRYTLTITDNADKSSLLAIEMDDYRAMSFGLSTKIEIGDPIPFTQQIFNIEQKFAAGFDPGRVMAAVREDASKLANKRASNAAVYPPEILALRNLLLHLGWTKTDVLSNPGEEYWTNPRSRDGIRVMDPGYYGETNLRAFLSSAFRHLGNLP